MLTPPIKAIMMGLGKNPSPKFMNVEKIGRRMMVTGVPARNADKSEEIPKVMNTAR
jgi:hypothetical protein